MEYLVQGWNQYNFLLSPKSVRNILMPYHIVVVDHHVEPGYTESNLEETLGRYSALYDHLLSGEKIGREHSHLFQGFGVCSDLSNCVYGFPHIYQGNQYLRTDFREPVAVFAPAALCVFPGPDGKLHCGNTSCHYSPEHYMGFQLQYPKQIQYKQGDGYEPLRPTTGLRTWQDFQDLKQSIQAITRPLRLQTPQGAVCRTNVRVDADTKSRLDTCFSLRRYQITVK